MPAKPAALLPAGFGLQLRGGEQHQLDMTR
jgi:hypothetical protein